MGTILSQVVGKLLGAGPVCDSECHHVQCCTSTQRVVDPRWPHPERPRQISDSTSSEKSVRSFFRRRKRIMTTIYIDSRKRVAGDDSSFEFDIGETIHMQTGAKLSVLKLRVADAFLSTDRGQFLYWIDSALGSLNWATLPAPTPGRGWRPGSAAITLRPRTSQKRTRSKSPTTGTAAC